VPDMPPAADWMNPEVPWWAKLRRAQQLIGDVDRRCEALNQSGVGWSLGREPEDDRTWRYIFRQPTPIPADLAVMMGDTIHNLRSAVDNAAHFLAVRCVRRTQQRS
jgi:hypothetical protein